MSPGPFCVDEQLHQHRPLRLMSWTQRAPLQERRSDSASQVRDFFITLLSLEFTTVKTESSFTFTG